MTPESLILSAGIVLIGTLFLAGLAIALDRLLPDRFVRERHDFALAALLVIPLIFALTFLPKSPDELSAAAALGETVIGVEETRAAPDTPWVAAPANETQILRRGAEIPWARLLVGVWLAGTLGALGTLVIRLSRLQGLREQSTPVTLPKDLRLTRNLEVRRHDGISSPILIGYLKPCILVPSTFAFDAAARPVLEHEVAHAARGDSWITLALHTINAVFWWNLPIRAIMPLYYEARETLCDTRSAIVTGAPETLAQALVDTVVQATRWRSPVLAAAAHGVGLKARIRRLMGPGADVERTPAATLAFILPAMVISTALVTPGLGEAHPPEYAHNTWGDDERESLYAAAYRGDFATLDEMIQAGVDPSKPALGDGTPLMGAIRGGNDQIVDHLIMSGVDVNALSPGDGTALIAAVRKGRKDLVSQLITAGANPNLGIEGDGAPLISAASRGNLHMVNLLLEAGADPNIAVPGDGNPLIAAALHNKKKVAKRLLEVGADPNGYVYRDETPLIAAAQQGHLDMGKLLVWAGADVSLTVRTPHTDAGGPYRSPISEAKRKDRTWFVNWLKEQGAEHRPRD
ncbi:MAG: M56 family metallopeptidase [Pseudomonadota bacterium]